MDTLTVQLEPQEQQSLREKHYNATLVERIDIHDDLARFRIRPDDGVPTFRPGQYVAIGLGYWEERVQPSQNEQLDPAKLRKVVRRAYSISCPIINPHGELTPCSAIDYLELYIVLVRAADKPPALTPRLFKLQAGDRLVVEHRIVGKYTAENIGPQDTVLFLGTGTGEAPHNAMATQLLHDGHQGLVATATTVRVRQDLGYQREHQALMQRYPNYRYLPYTTREVENVDPTHRNYVGKQYLQSEVASGRLERAIGREISPSDTHVFLCGNPDMIGYHAPGSAPLSQPGLIQVLQQRGFHTDAHDGVVGPGLIRFEKYW